MMSEGNGRPRVLVVEDEAVTALDLASELTGLGYEVCGMVDTADEAVAVAARESPRLVLMDIRLANGGDGIDTARRICAVQDTAIVFLTAQSDEATLARALGISPFGYLIKPFRARDLRIAVELAITKYAADSAAVRRLGDLAATDPLTGLVNRRRFGEVLAVEWDRSRREGRPLSVLMVDIDHFKAVNDTQGHRAGDECLVAVATAIRACCGRPGDLVGRWGGDEFLVLLPDTDEAGARRVAGALLQAVREVQLARGASPLGTTVSVGAATALPTSPADATMLIDLADEALYAAKSQGRNRVVAAASRR